MARSGRWLRGRRGDGPHPDGGNGGGRGRRRGGPGPVEALEGRTLLSGSNLGFEAQNLSEWSVVAPNGGTAAAVARHVAIVDVGPGPEYLAVEGTAFALLKTGGVPGSYTSISREFELAAGDAIAGYAFFDAGDSDPFNDHGQVIVRQGGGVVATAFGADVASVGDYGETPWTAWDFRASAAGAYTIEARVANVLDPLGDSYLGLDHVRVIVGASAPPDVSAPVLDAASDTGVSQDDGITNAETLAFTGTAEAGSQVVLMALPAGADPAGDLGGIPGAFAFGAVVAGDGSWGVVADGLPEGIYNVYARATDTAGLAATSGATRVIVDRTAPVISAVLDREAAATGWYNLATGAPTVRFLAADALSGLAGPVPGDATFGEGAGQSSWAIVADVAGNVASAGVDGIDVDLTAPALGPIRLPSGPFVAGNALITASAAVVEATSGLGTITWDWDAGGAGAAGEGSPGGVGVIGSHSYAAAGIYRVSLVVTDEAGNVGPMAISADVVVYDPGAGFLTGGGWIASPSGALAGTPAAGGKAHFGLLVGYKRGLETPDGNSRFSFSVSGVNFRSTGFDWLVVSGSRTYFQGAGTVNGQAGYGFQVAAVDGKGADGGGTDRIRIRIWRLSDDRVAYDSQPGADLIDDPATALGGGNIAIHPR